MVLYRGNKLSEWRNTNSENDVFGVNYQPGTTQHALYSVTKTWISALVGMLYRDGYLDWETEHPDVLTLGDIFPDEGVWNRVWDIPYPIHGGSKVPELKAITLGELMAMRTGYAETPMSSPLDDSLVQDLDGLVAWWHPAYRSGIIDSQTCFKCGNYLPLTGIVNYVIKEKTKTAANPDGWDPLDYARQTSATLPRGNPGLFEALGMEEGSYTWDRDLDGVARGATGLWADLEDMAKFGQLLLQGGKVLSGNTEKVVVPAYYLEEMTMTQSRMSSSLSPMGWQVWNWGADDDGESGFCAEGLGWQSICVFPKEEMVVAIQGSYVWGFDAFVSNLQVRNEAVKKIRDSITCPSTPAPTQPSIGIPVGIEPPAASPVDNNNGNDNNNNGGIGGPGGDNTVVVENGAGADSDEELESSVSFQEEEKKFTGLIVMFVLALLAIVFLVALLCYRKKKSREAAKASARNIEAFCKVVPPGREAFENGHKVYDVDLESVSKGSVSTEDSATYYAEPVDTEQRSSNRK